MTSTRSAGSTRLPTAADEIAAVIADLRELGLALEELPRPGARLSKRAVWLLSQRLESSRTVAAKTAIANALCTASARGEAADSLLGQIPRARSRPLRAALLAAVARTAVEQQASTVSSLYLDSTFGPERAVLAPAIARLNPKPVQILRQALGDPAVALSALEALTKTDGRGALTRIRELAKDPDPDVQRAAKRALSKLSSAPPRTTAQTIAPHRARKVSAAHVESAEVATEPAPPVAAPTETAADDYLSIAEGVLLYAKRPFRTASRSFASVGTLATAVSVAHLWSASAPSIVPASVAFGCYAVSGVLWIRHREP